MKLRVRHGYFIFEETAPGQVSDFMRRVNVELVSRDNHYTFKKLSTAPLYSLSGKSLLGFTALKTFEGSPWEVFEANGVVYDFIKDELVPIQSVTQVTEIREARTVFVSPGLILPGSLTVEGSRIKDYSAWFSRDRATWHYGEVGFV